MDVRKPSAIQGLIKFRSPAALTLLGFALLLPGLGAARVLTYHEVCFAQPAREMIATGKLLIPTIAGISFPDKPPMMHWLVAFSMRVFGEGEFFVRLPSVIAAIGIVLLVYDMGRRCFGEAVGLIGGIIQLTTVYTLMQARLAECDILLCFLTTASLRTFGLVELGLLERSRMAAMIVHLCTGMAFLTKGPIAIVFIGGAMLLYLSMTWSLQRLKYWMQPAAFVISAALVFGWPTTAYLSQPEILEGWRYHNLERFSGDHGKSLSPFFYLAAMPMLLLPWTPFAYVALFKRHEGTADLRRLTIAWIVPGLIVLSAASWKHKHYIVPLLAPMSVWGARGLMLWAASSWKPIPLKIVWCIVAAASSILLTVMFSRASFADSWVLGIMIPAICGVAVTMQHWRKPQYCIAVSLGGAVLCSSVTLLSLVPNFDSYREQCEFALRIREKLPANQSLYVPYIAAKQGEPFALPENQIVYYLPLNIAVLPAQNEEVIARMSNEVFYVLAPEHMQDELEAIGRPQIVDQCDSVRGAMAPEDRLSFFRVKPTAYFSHQSVPSLK